MPHRQLISILVAKKVYFEKNKCINPCRRLLSVTVRHTLLTWAVPVRSRKSCFCFCFTTKTLVNSHLSLQRLNFGCMYNLIKNPSYMHTILSLYILILAYLLYVMKPRVSTKKLASNGTSIRTTVYIGLMTQSIILNSDWSNQLNSRESCWNSNTTRLDRTKLISKNNFWTVCS